MWSKHNNIYKFTNIPDNTIPGEHIAAVSFENCLMWGTVFDKTLIPTLKELHLKNFDIIIFSNQGPLLKTKISSANVAHPKPIDDATFQRSTAAILKSIGIPLTFYYTTDPYAHKPSIDMWRLVGRTPSRFSFYHGGMIGRFKDINDDDKKFATAIKLPLKLSIELKEFKLFQTREAYLKDIEDKKINEANAVARKISEEEQKKLNAMVEKIKREEYYRVIPYHEFKNEKEDVKESKKELKKEEFKQENVKKELKKEESKQENVKEEIKEIKKEERTCAKELKVEIPSVIIQPISIEEDDHLDNIMYEKMSSVAPTITNNITNITNTSNITNITNDIDIADIMRKNITDMVDEPSTEKISIIGDHYFYAGETELLILLAPPGVFRDAITDILKNQKYLLINDVKKIGNSGRFLINKNATIKKLKMPIRYVYIDVPKIKALNASPTLKVEIDYYYDNLFVPKKDKNNIVNTFSL